MNIATNLNESVTLELRYRQSITVAPGSQIVVDQGILWITANQNDVILHAQESHLVGEEPQVVQALADARIRIEGANSARFLQLA